MENLMSYPDLRELLQKLQGKMSGSNRYQADNLIRILDLCAEMVTTAGYDRKEEIQNEIYEILA